MKLSSFSLHNAVVLFFAALLGGTLNAVAGGGSFIAFPALIFTGVPAVPANATNTVGLWCGLVCSGGAFRHHLKVKRSVMIPLVMASLAGGMFGALLLLGTPGGTFLRVLPWLMGFAVLLFIFGPYFAQPNPAGAKDVGVKSILAALLVQLLVAIYGGYFGGGIGFVILAMLAAFGMGDIHEMNAFKTVLSSSTNGMAVLIFILRHAVYWPQASVMICGAAIGGYCGAHYSLRLPRRWIRWFVIAVGAGMTTYFFARAY